MISGRKYILFFSILIQQADTCHPGFSASISLVSFFLCLLILHLLLLCILCFILLSLLFLLLFKLLLAFFAHVIQICRMYFSRHAIHHNFPLFQPDRTVTDLLQLPHGMRYDYDGHSLSLYLSELIKALCLKIGITHCQYFIYQQNICSHINGYGKCKTHIHTGRIGSDRIINIILQL